MNLYRRPSRLRIGLLLDGWQVPAWVLRVVEEIESSEIAGVVVVVLRRPPARPSLLSRLWLGRRYLLYRVYSRLDRRLLRLSPDAFASRNLQPLLADRPEIEVEPRSSVTTDRFEPPDLDAIRRHHPDLLLRFGFRILRGKILDLAPYGVWSYHHGDNLERRGGPPGFWEVAESRPLTGSVLQVLTEDLDAGRVIYRSYAPTHLRSVVRNRNHVYWKSASFVGRCLRALTERGDSNLSGDDPVPDSTRAPLYRKPGNVAMLRFLSRLAWAGVGGALVDRLTRKQWFLAWRFSEASREPPQELRGLQTVMPPRDRVWADPFPVQRDGRWIVYFEERRFSERRGTIRAFELDPKSGPGNPFAVLEEPFHLSYPFLFDYRGELFLMPESAGRRQVRIYRCIDFPAGWELEGVVLDNVEAVDATLHQEGDQYFLLANIGEPGTTHANDELHLFYAASPLGPWTPVRHNPVVSDARSARPAGRLFRRQGELYRPAQDCSRRYGSAISLQRVRQISKNGLSEETVARIEPRWAPGLLATHTLNRAGKLTTVDGMRRIWR